MPAQLIQMKCQRFPFGETPIVPVFRPLLFLCHLHPTDPGLDADLNGSPSSSVANKSGGAGASSSSGNPGGPLFFIGVAQLHLKNLPEAADLQPEHAFEFKTKLTKEGVISFCDQRVGNLFPGIKEVFPQDLVGKRFADLVVGAEDKRAFKKIFNDGAFHCVYWTFNVLLAKEVLLY